MVFIVFDEELVDLSVYLSSLSLPAPPASRGLSSPRNGDCETPYRACAHPFQKGLKPSSRGLSPRRNYAFFWLLFGIPCVVILAGHFCFKNKRNFFADGMLCFMSAFPNSGTFWTTAWRPEQEQTRQNMFLISHWTNCHGTVVQCGFYKMQCCFTH